MARTHSCWEHQPPWHCLSRSRALTCRECCTLLRIEQAYLGWGGVPGQVGGAIGACLVEVRFQGGPVVGDCAVCDIALHSRRNRLRPAFTGGPGGPCMAVSSSIIVASWDSLKGGRNCGDVWYLHRESLSRLGVLSHSAWS